MSLTLGLVRVMTLDNKQETLDQMQTIFSIDTFSVFFTFAKKKNSAKQMMEIMYLENFYFQLNYLS